MLALPFEKVPWRLTPFEEIVTVIPFGRPAQLIIKDPDEYVTLVNSIPKLTFPPPDPAKVIAELITEEITEESSV